MPPQNKTIVRAQESDDAQGIAGYEFVAVGNAIVLYSGGEVPGGSGDSGSGGSSTDSPTGDPNWDNPDFNWGPPQISLSGSDYAVPRGVETIFQYNGLVMNDRSVVDKIIITSIDGLDDADIRDSREDNPADDGETPYDAHYGGRTIVLNGSVRAYRLSKLRDMQQALRKAFATLEEQPLYFNTGDFTKDHYIICRKLSKINMAEEQKSLSEFFRDFSITLRASNPRFFRLARKATTLDPLAANQLLILNEGNFSAEPQIRLHGPLSDVVFEIQSIETGAVFPWSLLAGQSVPPGDYYQIDVPTKTVQNSFGVNKYTLVDPSSVLPKLLAGQSYLSVPLGKMTGGGTIEISWQDSYI